MSLISVITINFNNAVGLQKTINSVVSQSDQNFEYIVIDGGSTDGSTEMLKQNSRIDYWTSERDAGIYDAMNKGILRSTGQYLLFLNSGDYLFENNTFEKIAPNLNNADILYGNLKIDEKGILKDGFMPDEITLSQMMKDTLWHPVSFIKRELFTSFGLYNTQYKICGDYDFFFKAIINYKATTKHLHQFIAVFDLNGISSDIANAALINQEKEKIQHTYVAQNIIDSYKIKAIKPGFFETLKTRVLSFFRT